MIINAPSSDNNPQLGIVRTVIGLGLLFLLVNLFHVQILERDRYGDREQAQSLRRIRLPAARGEIVDRNGVVLANNRPSYDVAISLDQLGRISKRQDVARLAEKNIQAVSTALNLPVTVTDENIRNHYNRRRPLPMPLWRDLPPQTVAAFVERAGNWPGTDLLVTPVRQYPNGQLAAHLLGFCGRAEQTEEEEVENFYYYQPDRTGKQGVEHAFDSDLRGAPGGHTIRVNPSGVKVAEVGSKPAERGNRIVLTIDARIQRIVETALAHTVLPAGKELRGSVVVLDPRTGEILALASAPAFDPNVFSPGTPSATVTAVLQNPGKPMIDRAVGAWYAPGSTFKPVTLLAGLEAGTIASSDTATCSGALQIGNRRFGCWNSHGHGRVDLFTAMMQSCDVWFYQEGLRTGVDALAKMASEFGLGQSADVDFAHDLAGVVPTSAWKRSQRNEKWWDGDTAQLAIGQGFLLATPLQMANVAATLANRGTRWRPFVVKEIESPEGQPLQVTQPAVLARLSARPQNVELVRQTMRATVQSTQGTGHHAAIRGVNVAGKTGTAEFDLHEAGTTRRINRAWFIGFAPYEQPSVAVAILIEDGVSGGHVAAPVAGQIFAGIFQSNVESTGGGTGYVD
ncbi:MAG: penicillin-binding protein 2 [Verrucomicrobiota bacterium]